MDSALTISEPIQQNQSTDWAIVMWAELSERLGKIQNWKNSSENQVEKKLGEEKWLMEVIELMIAVKEFDWEN